MGHIFSRILPCHSTWCYHDYRIFPLRIQDENPSGIADSMCGQSSHGGRVVSQASSHRAGMMMLHAITQFRTHKKTLTHTSVHFLRLGPTSRFLPFFLYPCVYVHVSVSTYLPVCLSLSYRSLLSFLISMSMSNCISFNGKASGITSETPRKGWRAWGQNGEEVKWCISQRSGHGMCVTADTHKEYQCIGEYLFAAWCAAVLWPTFFTTEICRRCYGVVQIDSKIFNCMEVNHVKEIPGQTSLETVSLLFPWWTRQTFLKGNRQMWRVYWGYTDGIRIRARARKIP